MKHLALAALLVFAGCGHHHSAPRAEDSKSNWLRTCAEPNDCGDGLSCLCGVCTVSCDDAAACERVGGAAAICAESGTCATQPVSACFAACDSDGDCGDDQRCVEGGCIATASAPTPVGSGDGCVERSEACNAVDDDCDYQVDEGAEQSCESIILNAETSCVPFDEGAVCVLMQCNVGYADCDGDPANGCEEESCTCNPCSDAGSGLPDSSISD